MVAFILVISGATLAIASPRVDSPSNTSSNPACNMPSHVTNLAAQVEQDPRFVQAAAGLRYALVAANDDGATRGTVNGKPFYAPPKTNLIFYSFGTDGQSARCPMTWDLKGVVGALWVKVPKNPDGSYILSSMSVYFTPGVFINSTIIKK